jgi:hypothetical protein
MARLTRQLSRSEGNIAEVSSTNTFPDLNSPMAMVKIGNEWIGYRNMDGKSFRSLRRGLRGTVPQEHPVGTPVTSGMTFSRIVKIPGARKWDENE